MRQLIIILFLGHIFSGCNVHGNNPAGKNISGKWSNITETGGRRYEFIANFRPDGTYDGILNGKVLVSGGKYSIHGDTIGFQDAICNAVYIGVYQLHYNQDSVSFRVIRDSCTVRRQGTDGVGMKWLGP